MKQLSIYSRQKHYSKKDVTISIGQNDRVNITFRNNSWKHITDNEYIRIWAVNGCLKFGDGLKEKRGKKYKLFMSAKCPTTRYINFKGYVMPEAFKIIERNLKHNDAYSFDLADLEEFEPCEKTDITNLVYSHDPVNELIPETVPTDSIKGVRREGDYTVVKFDLAKLPRDARRAVFESMPKDGLVESCLLLLDRLEEAVAAASEEGAE